MTSNVTRNRALIFYLLRKYFDKANLSSNVYIRNYINNKGYIIKNISVTKLMI